MANLNESVYGRTEAQRLLKKYGNRLQLAENAIREKRGLEMTYERKLSTAICLENTSRRIRAMEANLGYEMNPVSPTQPGNIGQYKRYSI